MTHSVMRRFLAATAALTLGVGLVACSQETADKAGDAAASATSAAAEGAAKATSAAGDAAAKATSAAAEAGDKMSEAAGEMVDVELAGGETAKAPKDLATAIENDATNTGQPKSITEKDGVYIAQYPNADMMVYAKEIGAVPVVGKIGDTWSSQGGADSEVGLPTAPEKKVEGKGWTQSFQHGRITWDVSESTTGVAQVELTN